MSLVNSRHAQASTYSKLAGLLCKASIEPPAQECGSEGKAQHDMNQSLTFKQANSASNRLPDGGFRALCRRSSYYRYSLPGTPRSDQGAEERL